MAATIPNVELAYQQATKEAKDKVPPALWGKFIPERALQILASWIMLLPDWQRNTVALDKIVIQSQKDVANVPQAQKMDALKKRIQAWINFYFFKATPPKPKNLVQKSITEIAKGVKKTVMFGIKLIGKVLWLPLLPFVPAMKHEISNKGKTPKNEIDELAQQFVDVVINKGYDKDHVVGAIASIIPMIINWFKGKKDDIEKKIKEGKPLTAQETKTIELMKEGEDAVVKAATEAAEAKAGNWLNQNKKPIIIVTLSAIGLTLILVGRSLYVKGKQKAAA